MNFADLFVKGDDVSIEKSSFDHDDSSNTTQSAAQKVKQLRLSRKPEILTVWEICNIIEDLDKDIVHHD